MGGGGGERGSQKRPIFACFQCRKYANIGGRGDGVKIPRNVITKYMDGP